jgi:hypothetical protein
MRFETLVNWGFENRRTFRQLLGGSSTSSTTLLKAERVLDPPGKSHEMEKPKPKNLTTKSTKHTKRKRRPENQKPSHAEAQSRRAAEGKAEKSGLRAENNSYQRSNFSAPTGQH